MKRIAMLALLLVLGGCSSLGKLMDAAGTVNDNALLSAEETICRMASIGSIKRRYGTLEKANAWKELCTEESQAMTTILEN